MNFEFLNDSTLWVAISFILVCNFSIKPIINQLSVEILIKKLMILKKVSMNQSHLKRKQKKCSSYS